VLSLAMVQGAVYDAVNAIDGGYEPYLAEAAAAAAAAGDSVDAASATAAYRVLVGFPQRNPALVGLVPTQHATLQPLFAASLASVPDGPSKTGGRAAGRAAAEAMLTARLDDGRGGTFKLTPGTDPGDWRLAPPQGPSPGIVSQDPAPWVGFVRPFLVPNVEMLRTDGPNDLTSEAYLEDFREVKRIGSLTSTRRTADQTAASIFWQDNGAAIWNRVFRSVAMTHDLDVVDSARFLAMTNLAAADGSIGCWNDKAYWSFWRPITAIREAGHWEPGNQGRPGLGPAVRPDGSGLRPAARDARIPRPPLRALLCQQRHRALDAGLLRHRQRALHGDEQQVLARAVSGEEFQPSVGRAEGDRQRPGLERDPFPDRGRARSGARRGGRRLHGGSLLRANELIHGRLGHPSRMLEPAPLETRGR